MVEVGIRELKSRLSYYVQLMQAGETVAIKVRDRVVGFLSRLHPRRESERERRKQGSVERLLKGLKEEGLVTSEKHHSYHPPRKLVTLKGGITASEMIRKMRDEERW